MFHGHLKPVLAREDLLSLPELLAQFDDLGCGVRTANETDQTAQDTGPTRTFRTRPGAAAREGMRRAVRRA